MAIVIKRSQIQYTLARPFMYFGEYLLYVNTVFLGSTSNIKFIYQIKVTATLCRGNYVMIMGTVDRSKSMFIAVGI